MVKLGIRDLAIRYGSTTALEGVSFDVHENEIFGIIGPANAGKTSFLKAVNRMDLFNSDMKVEGGIVFNDVDVRKVRNVYGLRRRIGVVFPLPVGLPLSIYDNVALSPRLSGQKNRAELDVIVERCLTRAALWDEVKDRLNSLGSLLSGGQQQRLTIARATLHEPDVLLLDEPYTGLDQDASQLLDSLLQKESENGRTILMITHNPEAATYCADRTVRMQDGRITEE